MHVIFKYIPLFNDKPYVANFLFDLLEKYKCHMSAIQYFDKYADQLWAEELLLKAMHEKSYYAFEYYDIYASQPWAKDCLLKITAEDTS